MRHNFLLEIGTEELPSSELKYLAKKFYNQIYLGMKSENIKYSSMKWFATPRRIAVKIEEIISYKISKKNKKMKPDVISEFKKNSKPLKEVKLLKNNFDISIEKNSKFQKNKCELLIYNTISKKNSIKNILYKIINKSINKIKSLKMMRWGNNKYIQFFRPVHTITMLLDNKIIPCNIFGINSNRIIYGHRFMGKKIIKIDDAKDYPEILISDGKVIADYNKRKKIIYKKIIKIAKNLGGMIYLNNFLLDEITSSVEWPVILKASFEKNFLKIPKEVIIYTMENKQKCFPIYSINSGRLLSSFIFVANLKSKMPQQIINGNEKVISSRLSDAQFFYDLDRKKKLKDYLSYLKKIIFHKNLGTLYDKSYRIKKLSIWIAIKIGANKFKSSRAALLSKCDLVTNMVFEFPIMQGIIGMYYAFNDGEDKIVSIALKEQYYPRFSGDKLPTNLVSYCISISDKIDTLVGFFSINQIPKKSKDPYALRRISLGIIRIILEKNLPINIKLLVKKTIKIFDIKIINKSLEKNIISFLNDRLQFLYQEKGYSINTIKSVLSCCKNTFLNFDDKIQAIQFFSKLEKSKLLIETSKRICNILLKFNINKLYKSFNSSLLQETEEIILASYLLVLQKKFKILFKLFNYKDILLELMILIKPIDNFFKNVLVKVKDKKIKNNRLFLLNDLKKIINYIGDISLL